MKALTAVLLLFFTAGPLAAHRYDAWFIESATIHFGRTVQPAWLKAVGMAESALKADARSYVGAEGIMQFMPATWAWIAPEPWKSLGALDPHAAIWVAGRYLRTIWNIFPNTCTYDRKAFSNAGYNSGPGNVNKARRACVAPCNRDWWDAPHVEARLVTAPRFQQETRTYVRRIRTFEQRLIAEGELLW